MDEPIARGSDESPLDPSDDADEPTNDRGDPKGDRSRRGWRHWLRSETVTAALIGALAAIMVGAITLLWTEYQSVEEFRRDQRQAEYSKILSKATDLANATEFAKSNLNILGNVGLPYSYYFDRTYVKPYYCDGEYRSAPCDDGAPSVDGRTTSEHLAGLGQRNPYSPTYPYSLGTVRTDWQSAYAALDQAIAEAQIAGKSGTLGLARALRDRYREDYAENIKSQLDSILTAMRDVAKNDQNSTSQSEKKEMSEEDRKSLVNDIVGVPIPDPAASGYPQDLLTNDARTLTGKYVKSAKDELDLNDE